MWLVREKNKEGGLLCRTETARDIAVRHFQDYRREYEVVETNTHVLPDPAEC